MSIKYLGHSCFEIKTTNGNILIDPFLSINPEYKPEGITDIFLTHAHGDHLGDAIRISQETGAVITAVFELANYCIKCGAKAKGIGLGGWHNYDWGRVAAVPAFHSSSLPDGEYGGCPCGYVFEIEGSTIYHAGDTCLNNEMKTIGEFFQPDMAMLPVGGFYTMDIEQAVKAAEWLGVTAVIPMHYNTFDAISVDISEFERQIREKGKLPVIMKINQELGKE